MIDSKEEKLYAACCHHFCMTDQMTAEEFDDYSSEHCEDCPVGDLARHYENEIERMRKIITDKLTEEQIARQLDDLPVKIRNPLYRAKILNKEELIKHLGDGKGIHVRNIGKKGIEILEAYTGRKIKATYEPDMWYGYQIKHCIISFE